MLIGFQRTPQISTRCGLCASQIISPSHLNNAHPLFYTPPPEKACCGEIGFNGTVFDDTAATLKSMYTGDASIEVTRLSSGTGERLGGTWYLSLDGEASVRIDAGALAEEVSNAIANLTAAGNVSVTDGVEGEGYNGERSWVVTFDDWNDPNRTAMPPTIAVGYEDLVGTGAAVHLKTADAFAIGGDEELQVAGLCDKGVVQLSSLLFSGVIDDCVVVPPWNGGTTYTVPSFPFDANSSTVKTAFEKVNQTVLGEVWVSRDSTSGSGGGVWNVTFVDNAEGRTPGLQCGLDADVSHLVNASCDPIGGFFVLTFDGNATEEIAYNASALEVRN